MSGSLVIPGRFNGPEGSGNGGYAAGLFAALLDGPAAVSLRSPVPLDTELEPVVDDGAVRVFDGDTLIAEAARAPALAVEVPAPVPPAEARAATPRYRGSAEGPFSRCFVCGRARGDSLGIFAGPVPGRDVVASPWTPPSWAAGEGGVRPEIVWAALDCPTYFAAYGEGELAISFLARFEARLEGPVEVGEEHVVMAWPISVEGRKREAGSALLTGAGERLAVARALLVEPRHG